MDLQNNEGVLLINLGSPKELNKKSVREYLRVFLSDDNVVDLPKFFQQLILRLFILPFRPKNTLEAYEKIWTKDGSPLIISTESIAKKLTKKTGWNVEIAMRYEDPSIEQALKNFEKKGINKIYVISLYPHNAMATTVTTELETRHVAMNISNDFELIFTKPFFDNEEYINAMVNSIKPYVESETYDKIIFSYHGLPMSQLDEVYENGRCDDRECEDGVQGDNHHCYRATCYETTKLLVEKIGINSSKTITAFQSRLDSKWVKPFSDKVLEQFAEEGVKNVLVVSPSFTGDCLETIIEIGDEYKELFIEKGGQKLDYVPSLNSNDSWVRCIVNIIRGI